MRDYLVTAGGAVLAVLLVVAILYQPSPQQQLSRPASTDSGADGYLALQRWLELSAVPSFSLRTPLSELDDKPELAARGNVMILTMPFLQPLQDGDAVVLNRWIRRGNTVLILAALNDSPAWILNTPTGSFMNDVAALTDLYFESAVDEQGEPISVGALFQQTPVELRASQSHPLLEGVSSLSGVSDSPAAIWLADISAVPEPMLALAVEQELGFPALWLMQRGEGHMVVSAAASLFGNRVLDAADNGQFLRQLLAYHLRPGGSVIFDDYHQGLSEIYDPEAFYSDQRLHITIAFLLAFWLVYLVGSSGRLIGVLQSPAAPQQVDLVRAIAGFMSRKMSRRETGRALVQNWLDELTRTGQIGAGDPWVQLAQMPLVDPDLLRSIEQDYRRLNGGKNVQLLQLHQKIVTLKRMLA